MRSNSAHNGPASHSQRRDFGSAWHPYLLHDHAPLEPLNHSSASEWFHQAEILAKSLGIWRYLEGEEVAPAELPSTPDPATTTSEDLERYERTRRRLIRDWNAFHKTTSLASIFFSANVGVEATLLVLSGNPPPPDGWSLLKEYYHDKNPVITGHKLRALTNYSYTSSGLTSMSDHLVEWGRRLDEIDGIFIAETKATSDPATKEDKVITDRFAGAFLAASLGADYHAALTLDLIPKKWLFGHKRG